MLVTGGYHAHRYLRRGQKLGLRVECSSRRLHLGDRALLSLELSDYLAVAALASSLLQGDGCVLVLDCKPRALGLSTIVVLDAGLVQVLGHRVLVVREGAVVIDVLEHVEPFYVEAVLIDLRKITNGHGFFTIHTGPAVKTLADGRNAHLIQNPASWWLPKLCDHFEILHLQASPGGFWIVVSPKNDG